VSQSNSHPLELVSQTIQVVDDTKTHSGHLDARRLLYVRCTWLTRYSGCYVTGSAPLRAPTGDLSPPESLSASYKAVISSAVRGLSRGPSLCKPTEGRTI